MSDIPEQVRWDLSLILLTILSGAARVRGMGSDMSCRRRHDDPSIDTGVAWLQRVYDLLLEAEHAPTILTKSTTW